MERRRLLGAGVLVAGLGCGSEPAPRPFVEVHTVFVGGRAVSAELADGVLVHQKPEALGVDGTLELQVEGTSGASFDVTVGPAIDEGPGTTRRARVEGNRLRIPLPDEMALDVPYLVRAVPVGTTTVERGSDPVKEIRLCVFSEGELMGGSVEDLRGPIFTGTRYGSAEALPGGSIRIDVAATDRTGIEQLSAAIAATMYEPAEPVEPPYMNYWPHAQVELAYDSRTCLYGRTFPVPAGIQAGTITDDWELTYVIGFEPAYGNWMDGAAGHPRRGTSRRYFDWGTTAFPLPWFEVGQLPVDTEPPAVSGATIVATTDGYELIITASDDHGVAGASARLERWEDGTRTWSGWAETTVGGDGVLRLPGKLPSHAPPGRYQVAELVVRDWADNFTLLAAEGAEYLAEGAPTGIAVLALEVEGATPPDRAAPTLLGVSVGGPVASEHGTVEVPVEVRATDDAAGISNVVVLFGASSGRRSSIALEKSSDEIWTDTFELSPEDEAGTWEVVDVRLFDHAGRLVILQAQGDVFVGATGIPTAVAVPAAFEHVPADFEAEALLGLEWVERGSRPLLRAAFRPGTMRIEDVLADAALLHEDGERSSIRLVFVGKADESGVFEVELDLLPSYASLEINDLSVHFRGGGWVHYRDRIEQGAPQLPAYERSYAGAASPTDIPIAHLTVR